MSAILKVGKFGIKGKKIKSLTPPRATLSIKLPIAPPNKKEIANEYTMFVFLK